MKEVGKEIKSYTELNGRTDSNMIDALNALYNYDMPKNKLIQHMESKELSLTPHNQGYLDEYQQIMNAKVQSKLDAIQQTFSNTDEKSLQQQLPDYTKKIKTFNTIPKHLQTVLPSKLTFMVDQTIAERETNPSHERMQRVQFIKIGQIKQIGNFHILREYQMQLYAICYKREIENSIQKVAEIGGSESKDSEMVLQKQPSQKELQTQDPYVNGQITGNNMDNLFF